MNKDAYNKANTDAKLVVAAVQKSKRLVFSENRKTAEAKGKLLEWSSKWSERTGML